MDRLKAQSGKWAIKWHICAHTVLATLFDLPLNCFCKLPSFLYWTHNRLLTSFNDSPPEEHKITPSHWRKHLLDLLVGCSGLLIVLSSDGLAHFLHVGLFSICQLDLCLHFRKMCDICIMSINRLQERNSVCGMTSLLRADMGISRRWPWLTWSSI